jgi:hypothetical protein
MLKMAMFPKLFPRYDEKQNRNKSALKPSETGQNRHFWRNRMKGFLTVNLHSLTVILSQKWWRWSTSGGVKSCCFEVDF